MSCALCDRIERKPDALLTKDILLGVYWDVFYCKTDGAPLAVLRRHSATMNYDELFELVGIVVCNNELKALEMRTQARKITDHIHFHFIKGE